MASKCNRTAASSRRCHSMIEFGDFVRKTELWSFRLRQFPGGSNSAAGPGGSNGTVLPPITAFLCCVSIHPHFKASGPQTDWGLFFCRPHCDERSAEHSEREASCGAAAHPRASDARAVTCPGLRAPSAAHLNDTRAVCVTVPLLNITTRTRSRAFVLRVRRIRAKAFLHP